MNKKKRTIKEKYIAVYLLDETPQKLDIISNISNGKKLRIVNATRENFKNFRIRNLDFVSNKYYFPQFEVWLQTLQNAEIVVTDSYHGVIFSIIFNKQFICIGNTQRGLTRMSSILKKIGLEERLVNTLGENINHLLDNKIDYSPVNLTLKAEKERSIEFLKNSINS
jgi:exopolysaccharide biosynthesis predicted pyruvyltransferase EpsI